MKSKVVLGLNFGDEGKGLFVNYFPGGYFLPDQLDNLFTAFKSNSLFFGAASQSRGAARQAHAHGFAYAGHGVGRIKTLTRAFSRTSSDFQLIKFFFLEPACLIKANSFKSVAHQSQPF